MVVIKKTAEIDRSFLTSHLKEKKQNNLWMGRLVDYAFDKKREGIFTEFPYELLVQKSKISFEPLDKICEDSEEFGESSKPTYIITMPYHNPSLNEIKRIVKQIEDESFGKDVAESRSKVKKRVAIVMGINTFESYDTETNRKFEENIERLRRYSQGLGNRSPLTNHVSLTILPFFWRHQWVIKSNLWELLDLPKSSALIERRIHPIQTCYRLAKSYFSHLNKAEKGPLLISEDFSDAGRPLTHIIPYQLIRNRILHSNAVKTYLTETQSELTYMLSLDGDFSSLKTEKYGLMTQYDQLIDAQVEPPHVMSTGYTAALDEKNELIILGLELDRCIRGALAEVIPRAVYMPEPNFAFLVNDPKTLSRLSWIGKDSTMHTESRRLIKNGIDRHIFEEDRMVFSEVGAIRTEIDSDWKTKSVLEFKKVNKKDFPHIKFQKALRGLHQSYADPEIWANNMYAALDVSISQYKAEGVGPLKNIRELFDPITIKNRRHPLESNLKQPLKTTMGVFKCYARCFEFYQNGEYTKQAIADYFIKKSGISGKHEKEQWHNFMLEQLAVFRDNKKILEKHYSDDQIEIIFKAAMKTGEAIQTFYLEKLDSGSQIVPSQSDAKKGS